LGLRAFAIVYRRLFEVYRHGIRYGKAREA
jgi:hypothetical protein